MLLLSRKLKKSCSSKSDNHQDSPSLEAVSRNEKQCAMLLASGLTEIYIALSSLHALSCRIQPESRLSEGVGLGVEREREREEREREREPSRGL